MHAEKLSGSTYNTKMSVNRGDSLVSTRLGELGCDDLLDGEDDTVLAPDAH